MVCVPIMLFPKPIIENIEAKKKREPRAQGSIQVVENKVYTAINDERETSPGKKRTESAL